MTHYSRRTYVRDFTDLQQGDLVDISVTENPYWSVVERIGDCEEDEYADEHCDGDCLGVIFHVDEGDVAGWHIARDESIPARLVADADQDVIDAQNETHAAAAAARAAQFEAAGKAA
jgi:hypothetical protein